MGRVGSVLPRQLRDVSPGQVVVLAGLLGLALVMVSIPTMVCWWTGRHRYGPWYCRTITVQARECGRCLTSEHRRDPWWEAITRPDTIEPRQVHARTP